MKINVEDLNVSEAWGPGPEDPNVYYKHLLWSVTEIWELFVMCYYNNNNNKNLTNV